MADTPTVLILGGCNGAGKSTSAVMLVPPGIPFLNADELAKVLPDEQGKHILAGRQLLEQWERMVSAQTDFALESTLSSRTLANRIRGIKQQGYYVQIVFMWLSDVELALRRVSERVQNGGHDIPEDVIRRRHRKGLLNFLNLYRPLADEWYVYNNEIRGKSVLIAYGERNEMTKIIVPQQWAEFEALNAE